MPDKTSEPNGKAADSVTYSPGSAVRSGRVPASHDAVNVINQRIFDTSLDLILVVDRYGTLMRVSPSSLAILGYRPDEMIGCSAKDFLYFEDLENTRNEMRLARRGRLTRNFECRYVHKDGRVVTLWWTGVWSEPEQQHFFIGRDMTERHEVERQLREVQQMDALLREGIDSIPEGFAIYGDDERLILCNKSYRQLFPTGSTVIEPGVRYEDVLRDGLRRGIYPDAEGHEEEWITARLRQHREFGGTVEQQLSDGCWVLVTKQKMTNGYTAGLRVDITAQKTAEEAVIRANRELSAIIAASPVAIFMLDKDGIVRLWNASAERVFGYSEDEALGRLPPYLVDEHVSDFRALLDQAIADPAPTGASETQRRRKDGKLIDVSVRWARVGDQSGQTVGIMYVVADVTEQKRVEAQLRQAQKMEAIGNLTGGLAHDFNNLLGIVILNLDSLRGLPPLHPDTVQLTGDALDAALRGADLTRRLLAFARRQPLQPAPTDANRLVSNTAKLLERMLGEHIEVSLQLEDDVWPVVIDSAQLESSLLNLATNARDAMPAGGRLIIATGNRHLDEDYAARQSELRPGDYAMLEVSDSGIGMTEEALSRAFEPFFTTKEAGKGSGLGLSMVFGFIKQSGGHINIYSEVSIGTTVRLYLPRANVGESLATEGALQPVARGSGETVLAVEDNTNLRRVVARQLSELGYRVLEADDAEQARLLLESEPVDILFTDIILPGGVSGYELATAALSRWPNLKIVLTSGFPDDKINGGAGAHNLRLLSKPYRRAELARVLRDVLAG